jgi:hypothetical protein
MQGEVSKCDLTPSNKKYDYDATIKELEGRYGFKNLGEGGFGVIVGNENCAIKIVKDISRCPEMNREKEIYNAIQGKINRGNFLAKVPYFSLYAELNNFCHFNMERIFSPLSGWGDVYDDDDYGHGYALSSQGDKYLFNDLSKKELILIDKNKVYNIDLPGNLIHFYVNHFDPDTKVVLDNNQGILLGKNNLEKHFTVQKVKEYTREIGRLLSFLISSVNLIPTDIEIVLASRSNKDREVVPFIYDFNEASFIPTNIKNDTKLLVTQIARSMHAKNGKHYFPNSKNPHYQDFRSGFIENYELGNLILEEYNKLFQ